ncbi:MAG: hypothetical protein ACI9YM_001050 [Brevundimonas sp.]|jgi:hypothetical protein|uniref:hypothetical protein n=1 Tax=Brevundimonas sp. TaxID=1871086 RepID=UPI002488F250|nr:hypothetical protein [Brevundimonas sp.]MDI1280119.1 hypothetical protein [Brevundimonas sp.]
MTHAPAIAVTAIALILSSCAGLPPAAEPQDAFFARLTDLCGQSFAGHLVTTDAADADLAGQPMRMQVQDCSAREIRIPFRIGDDRSRTWVITRTGQGLTLKHDHRDPQGQPDGLHWYGGDTVNAGTAGRQEFPVDQFSIDLFNAGDASVSTTNVWAMEIEPGQAFAYELRRANRHFRVEFDLTVPLTD